MTDHRHPPQSEAPGFWRSRYAVGLLVMGAIAAYLLASEHRGHFIGALPLLLILACPLMHVFMHNGQGSHGHGHVSRHGAKTPPAGSTPPRENNHDR
ncbi:MAG: hypothetical protein JWP47_883 [Polaromonas sp.]|jgi:hypothetical protein|nr:hypothetical protein [Polaromonas sp.]